MKDYFKNGWARFRSAVPNTERKIQLALTGLSTTALAMSAITWPGKLAIIGVICGYISASCAGMVMVIQFAVQECKAFAEPIAEPALPSPPLLATKEELPAPSPEPIEPTIIETAPINPI